MRMVFDLVYHLFLIKNSFDQETRSRPFIQIFLDKQTDCEIYATVYFLEVRINN